MRHKSDVPGILEEMMNVGNPSGAFAFFGGIFFAMSAPLWRRSRKRASIVLAMGASVVLAYGVLYFMYPDAQSGQAAIEANRRFVLLAIACELPVLGLALMSLKQFQHVSFWLGWTINLGYGLWLTAIFVWLVFFWHW